MLHKEIYFYTSTIRNWKPLLLNFQLQPVILESLSYLFKKGCVKVYGFVIMPNHIHLVWEFIENNGKESAMSSFKKFTAHQFQEILRQKAPNVLKEYQVEWNSRKYNFWKPKADWFLLNQLPAIEQKLLYIHLNPMRGRWNLVDDPRKYYYSSCRFYETGQSDFDFLSDYRDWLG